MAGMSASCCRRRTGSSSGFRQGFLHGYCTLEPDTEVIYKVTAPWNRAAERGVIWNDPVLAIPWPIDPAEAILSDKDRALPRLAECSEWHAA